MTCPLGDQVCPRILWEHCWTGELEDSWVGQGLAISTRVSLPRPCPPASLYRACGTRTYLLEQHGATHRCAQHGQRQNVAIHYGPELVGVGEGCPGGPTAAARRRAPGVCPRNALPGIHMGKCRPGWNPRLPETGGAELPGEGPIGRGRERSCSWAW